MASKSSAKMVITCQDETKQGIEKTKKSLQQFAKDVAKIDFAKALTLTGTITAGIAAVKKLQNVARECVNEYLQAEQAAVQFEATWKNVGKSIGKTSTEVMKLADSIELSTNFTAESVMTAAQTIAATGKITEDSFDRTLTAATDMAAALGTDVSQAASTLAKALQDPEKGLQSLKTAGITFTEAEKDMIKQLEAEGKTWEAQALILSKVEDRYKGVAKAVNDTPYGKLNNITDVLGQIKEAFGEGLINAISPALEGIYDWLIKIKNWIDEYNEYAAAERNRQAARASLSTGTSAGLTADQKALAREAAVERIASLTESNAYWERQGGGASYIAQNNLLIAAAQNIIDEIDTENALLRKQERHQQAMANAAETSNKYYNKASQLYLSNDVFGMQAEENARLAEVNARSISLGLKKSLAEAQPEFTKTFSTAIQPLADNVALATTGSYTGQLIGSSIATTLGQVIDFDGTISTMGLKVGNTIANTIDEHAAELFGGDQRRWELMTEYNKTLANKIATGVVNAETAGGSTVRKYTPIRPNYSISPSNLFKALAEADSKVNSKYYETMTNYFQKQFEYYDMQTRANKTAQQDYERGWNRDEYFQRMLLASQTGYASTMGGKTVDTNVNVIDNFLQAAYGSTDMLGIFTDSLSGAAGSLASFCEALGPIGIVVWMLKEVLDAFMSTLNDLINQALAPFVAVLQWIGSELANTLAPILDVIGRWLALIGHILQTVLAPVISVIASAFKLVAGILDILSPVIAGVAKAFMILMSPVQWLADAISWLVSVITTAVWNISHPLNQRSYASFSSNAFDISGKMATIDALEAGTVVSTSSSTGVASAGYTGGNNLTFNFYNSSPIVGEDGMTQFCQMIRSTFTELGYYGA